MRVVWLPAPIPPTVKLCGTRRVEFPEFWRTSGKWFRSSHSVSQTKQHNPAVRQNSQISTCRFSAQLRRRASSRLICREVCGRAEGFFCEFKYRAYFRHRTPAWASCQPSNFLQALHHFLGATCSPLAPLRRGRGDAKKIGEGSHTTRTDLNFCAISTRLVYEAPREPSV